jgi:hypothetical protein
MIESVERLEDKTIYWFGTHPGTSRRVGLIVEMAQNCVSDEIATGYDLGAGVVQDFVDQLERKQ